eukprot:Nk52_evm1s2546 gene=Nk52_evmTU1s2546
MDKCKSLQTIPDQFKSSATVARTVFHFNGSSSSDDESDESDGQSSDGQSDEYVDDGADKDGGDEN